ncbi:MAG: methylated-DNA--[protein]-cysteine S-methyltransferase [Candidatus Aminicenantes bacterium]|nr:methylated-DNA--[protein]-cysteine S-methyltransferase [Candidatus Aminicenantes bacterium]
MRLIFAKIIDIGGFKFAVAEDLEGTIIGSSFQSEKFFEELKSQGFEIKEGIPSIMKTLKEYSEGVKVDLEKFPVKMIGTDFQKRVWKELRKIPYGETITYGELAKKLKTSPRAVGNAVARNRLPLFIPCHRVIGKNGLGGFTPDIRIKEMLIKLEGGKK